MLLSIASIYMLIRNYWVYERRSELNTFDRGKHVIEGYVDYDTMMLRFWVWDVEKMKLPNVEAKSETTAPLLHED